MIFQKAVQRLEKGGCRNLPKKLIFAAMSDNAEFIEHYKKKFSQKSKPVRSQIDSLVEDYLLSHNMRLVKKIQEGDKDDFFPIASNLYLVNDNGRKYVLKEHLQLYVDFSRINGYTNEKEILAAISHPNIIKCREVLKIHGIEFLKTDFFRSNSLAEFTDNHRTLPVSEAAGITQKLAETLDYLHSRNILYMDIKDKNVMYNGKDVLLLDFGMAQMFRKPIKDDQYATSLISTPKYVTPESGTLSRAYKKSDVFQLGILFYELLTGKHPFANEKYPLAEGDSHRESEVIKYSLANICKPYDSSPEVLHTYPEIGNLIESMLEKDYRKRPSAAEVKKRLEEMHLK